MKSVGKLLVAAIQHPKASRNRALKVNSFTTTPNKILAEFEHQTCAKWCVEYVTLLELKGLEKAAWDNTDPLAAMFTLRRIWTEGGTLYHNTDNKMIGLSVDDMDSLGDIVAKLVASGGGEGFMSGEL